MNKLTTRVLSSVLGLALGSPGIATAYDCTNAPDDIERLQAEKDSTAARAAMGMTAILPLGIIIHTIEGDEQQTLGEMDTDKYSEQLDQRIDHIKAKCKQ